MMITSEICLYGTETAGFGFIASHDGQLIGDGELRKEYSLIQTIQIAATALRKAGVKADDSEAYVYLPGGESRAVVGLYDLVATIRGKLAKAEPAPKLEISVDELLDAAGDSEVC